MKIEVGKKYFIYSHSDVCEKVATLVYLDKENNALCVDSNEDSLWCDITDLKPYHEPINNTLEGWIGLDRNDKPSGFPIDQIFKCRTGSIYSSIEEMRKFSNWKEHEYIRISIEQLPEPKE